MGMEKRREFTKLLLESINEAFSFSRVLLHFLEISSSLDINKIMEDPDKLTTGLRSLFEEGAEVIERRIIENLYSKLGINPISHGRQDFSEAIKKAYKRYVEASNIKGQ